MDKSEAIIREGKRKLLSLSHGVQAVVESKQVNELLEHYDTEVVQNIPPKQVKTIMFIITRLVRFSGGQTSILRLGTELTKQGYRVIYGVYKTQSNEEMQICAKSNLPGFAGELCTRQELKELIKNKANQPDVVVASSWDTVYYVKKFEGYKMYFVQDYEPYFYPFGEISLLAKKTYDQGLHMVSLGTWNKDMILRNCSPVSAIDCVEFPCDSKGYTFKERDYAGYTNKKTITLAVYMKYYGKRLPCIIQYMMTHLQEEFLKDRITLDVRYFGEAKSFSMKGGTNLGMLNHKELLDLYHKADFGIVASMSNISLVPYEMLAAGLPLVEFEDGTFPYFFPEDCAILTSISYKDLYLKLKESIQNPVILMRRSNHAMDHINTLSWEKTSEQFHDILLNIVDGD